MLERQHPERKENREKVGTNRKPEALPVVATQPAGVCKEQGGVRTQGPWVRGSASPLGQHL